MRPPYSFLLLCLLPLLSNCVFMPVTKERFDAECQVQAKHMEMEPVQIAALHQCTREQCAAFLAAAGVTITASAIISGSIVAIGNVVYWLEKKGRCKHQDLSNQTP